MLPRTLMCSQELELLVEMAHSLQKQGRQVNCLIYDGLLVHLEPGEKGLAPECLMKVMWTDPYTSEQLKEGVPLCEQIALARALFGDYRLRKMYIMVGDTSSGKGLLTEALERSCQCVFRHQGVGCQ